MVRHADISHDGVFRHSLTRQWADGPVVTWVGLNPSTADGEVDDPTIRRCVSFSQREGFARLYMVNLFDFRATKPADLYNASEPVSIWNDDAIRRCLAFSDMLICAWGAGASKMARGPAIRVPAWARYDYDIPVRCLGTTKGGFPRHPLYVRNDQPMEQYP